MPKKIPSKVSTNGKINIENDFNFDVKDTLAKIKKKKSILWMEKYCPKKVKDITSNKDILHKISKWFNKYPKVPKSMLLVNGIHGIGKTVALKLIAAENGYEIIYFNSSKSKKKIQLEIDIYSKLKNNTFNTNKKYCVIIDESETITLTSEKSAITELYKTNIQDKKFPLVFINNNQHSKLISDIMKHSLNYTLKKPTEKDLKIVIKKICKKEKITFEDNKCIEKIIEYSQFDYRQLLIILQDIYFTFIKEKTKQNININYKQIKSFTKNNVLKSKEISLFDATRIVLDNFTGYDELTSLYMDNKVLLPLMIHENYLKFMFYKYECRNNDKYISIMKTV